MRVGGLEQERKDVQRMEDQYGAAIQEVLIPMEMSAYQGSLREDGPSGLLREKPQGNQYFLKSF